MKSILLPLIVTCTISCIAETSQKATVVKLTPEQIAEKRAAAHKRQMEKFGGWVIDYRNMEGWIAIVNAQTNVSDLVLTEAGKMVSKMAKIDIRVTRANSLSQANFDVAFTNINANLAVFVVEDVKLPGLLLAPEQKWAVVNTSKYSGKNQSEWVKIEVMRALCYVSGAGILPDPTTTMAPITNPNQLSYINSNRVPFETCMNMINALRFYGITQYERCTYENACKGGWAPAPTNEFQKAIWDKVHSIPEKPIKIEFDPAAKKGKVTK